MDAGDYGFCAKVLPEPESTESPAQRRTEEVDLGTNAPQPGPQQRAGCREAIADEVICSVGAGAQIGRCLGDN